MVEIFPKSKFTDISQGPNWQADLRIAVLGLLYFLFSAQVPLKDARKPTHILKTD